MEKKKTITKKKCTANNSKNKWDSAIKVSDRVELKSVRLIASNCQQNPNCPPGQKACDIEKTVRFDVDKEQNIIGVFANIVLQAFGEKVERKKENSFLKIDATFLLLYHIKSLEGLDDEEFRNFAELNGVYNAWPYWREFVQNITGRMELPTLTIPVFRIVSPSKTESPKKELVEKTSKN